jgi:hypothetical protein
MGKEVSGIGRMGNMRVGGRRRSRYQEPRHQKEKII